MSAGGRGGSVIEVTNLNDSGPGSLRAAIEATGSRTVVFRIGGTVELQSPLVIINPYITIAGQTAPGGGITLKNDTNTSTSLSIQTHDVIIRYLRARPGPGGEPDGINILYDSGYNIILDHCSVSWAVDENISTYYGSHDITIQWCIISEGLRFSSHSKGPHSAGVLLGSKNSHSISVHHNLFVHNDLRNPLIETTGLVDFVNNVIYNYGSVAGDFINDYGDLPVNYIGNFVRWGPDSETIVYEVDMASSKRFYYAVYVHGNIGPHRPDESFDEAAVVSPEDRVYLIAAPQPSSPITTTSALEAYDQVLANAGAAIGIDGRGRGYWRRDSVDNRVVNDVRNTSGRIIDDPYDVGGWPALEAGIPPLDSDHDGMPDEWEDLNGFDPVDPADGPADAEGDGYTNLEAYLFSLALSENQPPSAEAGPDQEITLPDTAELSGTVSDDGLPDPPGAVTTTWSQVSGPGTATIAAPNALDTSVGFSSAGTYVLRLTADDGQLATSDEMTILVTGAGGEVAAEVQVAAGFDDAEESPSGNVSLTSTDLELGTDNGNVQTVGMRFVNVDVPQGAAIVDAYIQFTVDETDSGATSVVFSGEAVDNAAAFTSTVNNITSRSQTLASVSWDPVPWTAEGAAGPDQRTPNIAPLIQEIISRPGWVQGNALTIMVAGTGERTAESYDGNSQAAPLLHIVYSTGGQWRRYHLSSYGHLRSARNL